MRVMSRYKPVGWRGDSHRHYLASKGIKTVKHNYYSPLTYRLPPKTLMEKLTPEQKEEAKRLLALGELGSAKEVANHFGIDWEAPQSGVRGEYAPRMTEAQKLGILREIGEKKGRLPKSSDLEEYGMSSSSYNSMGGFLVSVNKVVDEEAEDAIHEGRDITQVADEWWFERKKLRKQEAPLEDRYGGLIPDEVRAARAAQQVKAETIVKQRDADVERKKRLALKGSMLKVAIKKLDEEISDLEEAYFQQRMTVSAGVLDELRKQTDRKKAERKRKDDELGDVKSQLGDAFFVRKVW